MEEYIVEKEGNQFYIEVEGEKVAYIEVKEEAGNVEVSKTFVEEKMRGKSLASKLMQAVYSYSLENNLKIEATCSYAQKWTEKNKK